MKHLVLSIAIGTLALAQPPDVEKKAEFEVASIRLAEQDNSRSIHTDNGQFRTHNITLKRLIANAYDVDIGQISGGPNWVDSDSYDISARIPEEFAKSRTRDTIPQMVQSLLADRFQLIIHREPRQISGFTLVVAKKGPKVERAKPDDGNSSLHSNNTHLTAENVTMETFAKHLTRDVEKLVVDMTGLTGGFNFKLDWMPDQLESHPGTSSDAGPSIFTALDEQLGLKLESTWVPISAIVIDRAEKPKGN